MIIGINGKIGSGKDTIGEIIQGLSITNGRREFEIKKFAGKLKQTASLLTGIPVEKFEDQDFKKTDLPNEWCYIENGYAAKNMTVREFLQKLGTDAMRNGLHTNVWVNALFADYRNFHTDKFSVRQGINEPEYPNWIITDMRFENEMEAVEQREGITIRVVRPGTTVGTHPSETALDDAEFDYEIINDGYISDLIDKVIDILTLEKLI